MTGAWRMRCLPLRGAAPAPPPIASARTCDSHVRRGASRGRGAAADSFTRVAGTPAAPLDLRPPGRPAGASAHSLHPQRHGAHARIAGCRARAPLGGGRAHLALPGPCTTHASGRIARAIPHLREQRAHPCRMATKHPLGALAAGTRQPRGGHSLDAAPCMAHSMAPTGPPTSFPTHPGPALQLTANPPRPAPAPAA